MALAPGSCAPRRDDVLKRLPKTTVRCVFFVHFVVLMVAAVCASCTPRSAGDGEVATWERQAQNVTIIRDDWGIPHVYGKTDADAVFGLIYAQAEDDFNRIETNYLNSMGRLAEAEGETEVYRDLR